MEVHRLIVRLIGDAKSFVDMTVSAVKNANMVSQAVNAMARTVRSMTSSIKSALKAMSTSFSTNFRAAIIHIRRFGHQYKSSLVNMIKSANQSMMVSIRRLGSIIRTSFLTPLRSIRNVVTAVSRVIAVGLVAAFNSATNALVIFSRGVILASRALSVMGVALGSALKKIMLFGSALGTAFSGIRGISGIVIAPFKMLGSIASGAAGIVVGAFKSIKSAIDSVGQSLLQIGAKMRAFGRLSTMYLTVPISIAGGAITKLGTSFEAEMAKIEGLVGISHDQVVAWGKEILKLGPKVGKGPVELAQAMYFVTSAGMRGKQAMDVLVQSAKGATGGLGETKLVVDAVTSAVNAYEKEGLTAAHATDVLVAAVREGKLEAELLAPVMGRAIPMAAALGVSFEDAAGQIALVSKTGETASRAVTSLSQFMMLLIKPSESARENLAEFGLEFKDLQRIAKQPLGVINIIRLLDQLSGGDPDKIAGIIPDMRALRGVMNIMAREAGAVDKVMKDVLNATGSTETAFRVAAATAKFKFNAALSELQGSLIELGGVVIPMVVRTVQRLVEILRVLMEFWRSLDKGTQEMLVTFTALVAAIGPVSIGLSLILSSLGGIISMIGMLLSPMGILIATLAALAAYLLDVGNMVDWFAEKWRTLKDHIAPAIEGIKNALKGGQVKLAFEIFWAELKVLSLEGVKALGEAWDGFAEGMVSAWFVVVNEIKKGWRAIREFASFTVLDMAKLTDPLNFQKYDDQQLIIRRSQAIRAKGPEFDPFNKEMQSSINATKNMLTGIIPNLDKPIMFAKRSLNSLLQDAAGAAAGIPKADIPGEIPSAPEIKLPGIPNIGGSYTRVQEAPKILEASRVGTLEHEQRLANYRATLSGRKDPSLEKLDKIVTATELMARLMEQESEGVPQAINFEAADFSNVG